MIARATNKPSAMNRTEARYAERLEILRRAGELQWWKYGAITLKLGDDCRYSPDFMVVLPNGEIEMHETKGFFRDDAKVKLRVAAAMFPFRFWLVRLVKGRWEFENY